MRKEAEAIPPPLIEEGVSLPIIDESSHQVRPCTAWPFLITIRWVSAAAFDPLFY